MTFKIQCQSHSSKSYIRYDGLLTIIPFVLCWSALQCLRYSYLKNWPWKSKFKVMGEVKVKSHNVTLTSYRLTSLSFHVNRPSHSWDTAISKFDVENSMSRSWVKSKLKVTTWGLHSVDSHPFRSMSFGHPIPELWLFENLTLKIKGQGHGWGHSSKSQCGSNILLAHIPFIPCQSGIWFPSYDFFKIWLWKSSVNVMGEVTVQSYNVDLTSYRLTSFSFHVNQTSDSWVTTFFKIWPWKSRVKVMGEVTVQSHNVGLTSYRFTSLSSMSIGPPIPEIQHFQNLTLKIQGQGQMTMMLHNYRSRQFHRTSNGINPSRGFRDMGSAMCTKY